MVRTMIYLNIFDQIKNQIIELLSKISWTSVFVLLTGIIVGFVMCAFIYLVMILASFRKNKQYVHKSGLDIIDEDIKKVIMSAKNQFSEESNHLGTQEKFAMVKDLSWQLINDIAKMYYPKSDYPIYELSLNELMMLNHYITNRVDSLFQGKMMQHFKKLRISDVLQLLEIKRRLDENKLMKVANKAKIPALFKGAMTVLNVFNPAYWVKKLMINTTMSIGTSKLALIVLDIVGEETVKVYSKNVFNIDKELESNVQKEISELQQGINSEATEGDKR